MNTASSIFVAGGTGMVGSAIIGKLISAGYYNVIANYHHRQPATRAAWPDVEWFRVDLTRQEEAEAFLRTRKPEYVFLASARVGGILANSRHQADFIYENLAIAGNVLHAAHLSGVSKLLNLGSSCIYPRLAPQPLTEEMLLTGPLEPTNEAYAIAKIAAIKFCRYHNEQYGTNFISVMPTNLYGPHDNYSLADSHVLPALIRRFHLAKLLQQDDWKTIVRDLRVFGDGAGRRDKSREATEEYLLESGVSRDSVTLWGTGEPRREFLHVNDLADACLFLMQHYDYQELGEFINIGTGVDVQVNELAEMVRRIVGFKGEIVHDVSKPDGMTRKLLDLSRIIRTGWKPKIPLEAGISGTYRWYLHHSGGEESVVSREQKCMN